MKRLLGSWLCVCLLLSALVSIHPAAAAEPMEGDNLLGATYGYSSRHVSFDERAVNVGLTYERFLVDDFSLEVGAFWPRENPGQEDFSVYGGVAYHFGFLEVPIRGTYAGAVEEWAVSSGAGLNFFAGPLNLRFLGLVNYSLGTAHEDRTSFTAEMAARFRF